MTRKLSMRTAVTALLLATAYFVLSSILAAPAQAAPVGGGSTFSQVTYDQAKINAAKIIAAKVGKSTQATAKAPLPGFCTLDGISGVTSYITCSVVVPATVYVYCSNGNIFYGYLPAPGIYSLSATPCYATGYSLV